MNDGSPLTSSTAALPFAEETVAAHLPGADPASGLWTVLWRDSGAGVALGCPAGRVCRANHVAAAMLGVAQSQAEWAFAPLLPPSGRLLLAKACKRAQSTRAHQSLELLLGERWARLTILPAVSAERGAPMIMIPLPAATTASPPLAAGGPEVEIRAQALADLNERERMVLSLIAAGMTSQQIGQRMGRSPKTIEYYRARLSQKLGASNRIQLARFAFTHGLTGPTVP
jgi:DNA-binding CsgD family transcriptional regulator